MTTQTHTFRRLALTGAVLVAAGLAVPRAAADPPTVPLPSAATSTPHLGEQLSGQDRRWLASNSQGKGLDMSSLDPLIADAIRASQGTAQPLGEQLSGQDRSWLASGSHQRTAGAGHRSNWGDAGIGAGSVLALVLIAIGGTLLIRGRLTPAH